MKHRLCRPCAEEMKKKGFKLDRKSLGTDAKITCERCGRRRYGSEYTEIKQEVHHG